MVPLEVVYIVPLHLVYIVPLHLKPVLYNTFSLQYSASWFYW